MARGFDENQEEDEFYIAVKGCNAEEIKCFINFLEKRKYLSIPIENISDWNGITFAKISFKPNFIQNSQYVDRLKFQLNVNKSFLKGVSIEKLSLTGVTIQEDSPNEQSGIIGYASRTLRWIKKSCQRDENLNSNIETFELRRNNIHLFYEEDLKSFFIRGTILRSIFNDDIEPEVEYFLEEVKSKIETAKSTNQMIQILQDDKYNFVRSYSNKLVEKIADELKKLVVSNPDSKDVEMSQCIKNKIESELLVYKTYNFVRDRIEIFPLHKLRQNDHLKNWISLKNSLERQPLFKIKDYFGVKLATYFAWAGFYTHMLIIASILGLLCIIFGLICVPYSTLSKEICSTDVIMCPRCDKVCDYWNLRDTCTYSILHHAIDNIATVVYTIFMSIWSALYLRQWQRYIAQYNASWDVINLDNSSQFSRPEYVKKVRDLLQNAASSSTSIVSTTTNSYLKVSKKVRLYKITFSFFVCLIWVLLCLGMVFSLVLYRMSLITSERLYGDRNSYSIYVVPVSTAVLDLIGIQVLNYAYSKIAVYLTESELPRTETEYENSLSLKLFMFQFVNYYSSIFYIAILKGKFTGSPGHYTRVFGFRQEECNPGGCLVELSIQLGIIMTGRQAIKLATPLVISYYGKLKTFILNRGVKKQQNEIEIPIYVKNYHLKKFDNISLMPEYLEMVIQFGFVTLFVAAFPLAPFFALLNNIFEVRLDGRKFLKEFRRPMPSRVEGIGVWLNIMSVITRIAAASNAFIIAFSSHFISKWVYRMSFNPYHNYTGYLNHSLATFKTKDFEYDVSPENSKYGNISTCYFLQYRNSADDENKYKKNVAYWHMMAIKLAFIVIYQFCISLFVMAVDYAVPSIPSKVKAKLRRNARFMLDMERTLSSTAHDDEHHSFLTNER
ncbi:hypothetical protein WA026_008963 [Henosepilachna vigintioctopunctata]|uniref:Anoctamin n=1 Tax=Henosepilachna vigintioctopunctata TaxID=420089 RepID=A0AAW1V3A7_9CUCU